MISLNRLTTRAKSLSNTGFGTSATSYGGRFMNKNGKPNLTKRGVGVFDKISWYHTMLALPTWKFLSVLLLFYIGMNILFAGIYFAIGLENLKGITPSESDLVKFGQAYFFSAQTFTTVGYGHISPSGFYASAVSAIEALTGLLSFAIATGLFFGRFSKPVVHLKFSQNAIIAPFNNGKALMFRLSPYKNTNYTDAEINVTLGLSVEEKGVWVNKFFTLDLEYKKINALVLSWTLVHPITKESPLFGFTASDFESMRGEILVYIKTFDDMFSTTVAAQTSYIFEEIVYGAKFRPMYTRSDDHKSTVLHLDKLNAFDKVAIE